MGTYVIVLAAASLVVVAFQFSCLFQYQSPKQEVEAPANACPEL